MDAHAWDERYRAHHQLFSGNPNGALVAEVAAMTPGQVLDVGCGEGGDAVWLAGQGWQVTGIDVAPTAVERATAAAQAAGVADRATFAVVDLTTENPPTGFDLVSAQYFPFLRKAGNGPIQAVLDAVRPGGTLLFVGHDVSHLAPDPDREFDPADYYHPADVAELLDQGWTVELHETRGRTHPGPEGSHHTHDIVLRARRRA